MALSNKEADKITHALGLDRPRRWASRNYFAAGESDREIWDSLVARGLAKARNNALSETMPYHLYTVTWEGIIAVGLEHKVPKRLIP